MSDYSLLCSTRHCPALAPLLQLITPSRTLGTADCARSLNDLISSFLQFSFNLFISLISFFLPIFFSFIKTLFSSLLTVSFPTAFFHDLSSFFQFFASFFYANSFFFLLKPSFPLSLLSSSLPTFLPSFFSTFLLYCNLFFYHLSSCQPFFLPQQPSFICTLPYLTIFLPFCLPSCLPAFF